MSGRDLSTGVAVSELDSGSMIAGKVGADDVLLVRRGEEVHAIAAFCSHYHGPLGEGIVEGNTIRCPWHHACFDLRTGAVVRAPAINPLPVWNVERRGDRYFVGARRGERVTQPEPGSSVPASVVIVGAGPAGVYTAVTLRREGYMGRISLISRESDLPYDKPNLSKDYLAGAAPPEWLPLYPSEFYEDQRIELRLGVTVSSLDIAAKCVITAAGERISFDALVLATGASPKTLPIAGVNYLRTRRDAETIVARASSARTASIIGAGFIGLEVAASLRQKGLDVTVITPDAIPLRRILGDELGRRVREIHESHGVRFQIGKPVDINADLVVAGIGVTPAIELAKSAGIATADGILVDEHLQTSVPGIYACGDVASWSDAHSSDRLRVEHWVVAGRHGQTVARNILGRAEAFSAVPFFWSAHYDVTISYVGHAIAWDEVTIDGSLAANDATITYRSAGRVKAVATIGRDRVSLEAELALETGSAV